MKKTFFYLVNKYFGDIKYNIHYLNLSQFCHVNKIDTDENYNLIQNGGTIYKSFIDNNEYIVDIYKSDRGDNVQVFIYNKDDTSPIKKYCVQLSYTNNDELLIAVIEQPKRCLQIVSNGKQLIKEKLSNGEIMMHLIINYAKENNFKRIILDDDSKYNCIDDKYKFFYELRHVHTLTKGYPWYYKFGFRYYEKEAREKVRENKKILDVLKTKDLLLNKFMEIILNKIISGKYYDILGDDNKMTIKNQLKIINLYNEYYEQSIYLFFDKFTKQYCNIMSKIYIDLFRLLNLKYIDRPDYLKMVLSLDK